MVVCIIFVFDVFKVYFGGCIWVVEDVWGWMYVDNSLKSELEERGEFVVLIVSVVFFI